MHSATYAYLSPTAQQLKELEKLRHAAREYGDILEAVLPNGPDKTYALRKHREVYMWASVALTRQPDGSPRGDSTDAQQPRVQEGPNPGVQDPKGAG